MTNIFEFAVRNKLRFNYKGVISVEDLWDLNVEELDFIYKKLNAQAKTETEESLLETKSSKNITLQTQLEIVKHIVKTKQEDKKEQMEKQAKASERARLREILARKQEENLEQLTEEEILRLLEESK